MLQGISRCTSGRDRGCHNVGNGFVWGDFIHPQRCGRGCCGLVGVGGAMQDEHEQLESLGLAVTQGCQWQVWQGVLECMNNVRNTSIDVVNGGGGWHWDLAGEPCNSVSDALSLGVIGPDHVALV